MNGRLVLWSFTIRISFLAKLAAKIYIDAIATVADHGAECLVTRTACDWRSLFLFSILTRLESVITYAEWN